MTKEAEVKIQINDGTNEIKTCDANASDITFYGDDFTYLVFENNEYNKEDFAENIKIKIEVNPKAGITIEKLNYDVECIKMPFGSKDVNGKKKIDDLLNLWAVTNPISFAILKTAKFNPTGNDYEDVKNLFCEMGFDDKKIYTIKNGDSWSIVKIHNGVAEKVVFSSIDECSFDEKGKNLYGEEFSSGDIISNNSSISILYK